ncbi:zinc finger protein CONSTANS-LIKE 4-like [Salvia divinorum]|uniref:Zinc finger protein CONSTANS-LIKE 4-like n=1 Tax=Salvia divinorum TaxID=28513 RepID=A0ABD1HHE0_SALDI
MKKSCELCKQTARIHCESDQASLCWDCDGRVHSANFLVARHSRNLLCRVCQSPTPWSAAGSKLEATYSACRRCAKGSAGRDGDREEEEKAAEEMAENHVAPWSPPPESSLSGGDGGEAAVTRKRGRLENDRVIIDDLNICTTAAEVADSVCRGISTRQRKSQRVGGGEFEARASEMESPTEEAAVRRFLPEEEVPGDKTADYRARAVDLNLTLGLFNG